MPMAMMALIAPGPNTAVMQDGDEQRRKREDQVVQPHDHLVEQRAAPLPPPRARAARRCTPRRRRRRSATAIEVARPAMIIGKHVAAELVGAEPMLRRGRLQLVGDVLRGRSRSGVQTSETAPPCTNTQRRPRRRTTKLREPQGARGKALRSGDGGASAGVGHCSPPQPRIDQRIGDVDEESHEDHRETSSITTTLHDDQVALGDALEDEAPEPRQVEHVLDDDGARPAGRRTAGR